MNLLIPSKIDSEYLLVGAHVEESVKRKIEQGEYVDFAKLLVRDRLDVQDDHRMVMINNEGNTYWTPYSDRASQNAVSSDQAWELAFRVFSDIYTCKFPHCGTELIQYNHIIYTASLTYLWNNVYKYDKDFQVALSCPPREEFGA